MHSRLGGVASFESGLSSFFKLSSAFFSAGLKRLIAAASKHELSQTCTTLSSSASIFFLNFKKKSMLWSPFAALKDVAVEPRELIFFGEPEKKSPTSVDVHDVSM